MSEGVERARERYAAELATSAGLRSRALVDALGRVPRERFVGTGPWLLSDPAGGYTETADADPRHLYVDVPVAIDPSRKLNNGQPSFVARLIDALDPQEHESAVHVGCGTGYFTALLAELARAVTAIEVDPELAERADANLRDRRNVLVVEGDGARVEFEPADAILINAGATHPLPHWLSRLRPGGRLIVPLTVNAPLLSVGVVLSVRREAERFPARLLLPVGIFPCAGARDPEIEGRLRSFLEQGSEAWARLRSVRADPHDAGQSCLVHVPGACLSAASA